MRVCVVGSGAREHAFAALLGRGTNTVVVTPGNPGIPGSVSTPPEEIDADLFVIGPEVPMVEGLADRLRGAGRLVVGPGADGAQLEGSKAWMKELLVSAGVATARHGTFSDLEPALAFLDTLPGLYVIKTSGLAAGKGVTVTESLAEARDAVRANLSGAAFGDAGRTVVLEEGMTGPELSVFALADGRRAVLFGSARDHKRVGDGDTGPNTGGMGAFSPVPGIDRAAEEDLLADPIIRTLDALRARGIDYRGFLYCGLMLTPEGPKVVEYNIRYGDPEAQAVLPRIEGDVTEILAQAAAGHLHDEPRFSADVAVNIACCVEGYPMAPRTGDVIEGYDEAAAVEGVTIFSAGVALDDRGRWITAGGRVLSVTGRGADVAQARERAVAAIAHLRWPGMHHRTDIGLSVVEPGTQAAGGETAGARTPHAEKEESTT